MTPVSARNSPGPDWIPFGWTRRSSRRRSARISKNGRAWRRPRESRRNEQDLLAQLVAHAVGAVETGSRRGDLGGEGLLALEVLRAESAAARADIAQAFGRSRFHAC